MTPTPDQPEQPITIVRWNEQASWQECPEGVREHLEAVGYQVLDVVPISTPQGDDGEQPIPKVPLTTIDDLPSDPRYGDEGERCGIHLEQGEVCMEPINHEGPCRPSSDNPEARLRERVEGVIAELEEEAVRSEHRDPSYGWAQGARFAASRLRTALKDDE